MKKFFLLLGIIFISENYFSQNGFCISLEPDPPFSGYSGRALTKGDFNNDGFTDFCVGSFLTNNTIPALVVGILLSDGTGSYTSMSPYAINFPNMGAHVVNLESGDFDNDGNLDLIASGDQDSAFYLLKGAGTGSFSSKTTFTTSSVPETLVAKDLNNDGKLDIVYSCIGSNTVSVMFASGTGFFNPVKYTLGNNPTLIVPGDFDHNGILDLFALAGSSTYFLKGSSNGTFIIASGPNLNATDVIVVDVNSDNKLDLVYTDISNNKLNIIKGYGNFTFSSALSYPVTGVAGTRSFGRVGQGDFNNDGKIDLVTLSNQIYISIFPGLGNGSFSSCVSYSVNFGGYLDIFNLIVADINNDSKLDIVTLADWNPIEVCNFRIFLNCNSVDVGIEEKEKTEIQFNLFPNPANDFLQLKFSDGGQNDFKSICIYPQLRKLNWFKFFAAVETQPF